MQGNAAKPATPKVDPVMESVSGRMSREAAINAIMEQRFKPAGLTNKQVGKGVRFGK